VPAIKGAMYINIYSNYQPALIKLDNENIGGHRYTFTAAASGVVGSLKLVDCFSNNICILLGEN